VTDHTIGNIVFGATAPPLRVQLASMKPKRVALIFEQEDADAITRLHIHGLLTDAQARQARQKLTRRIERGAGR